MKSSEILLQSLLKGLKKEDIYNSCPIKRYFRHTNHDNAVCDTVLQTQPYRVHSSHTNGDHGSRHGSMSSNGGHSNVIRTINLKMTPSTIPSRCYAGDTVVNSYPSHSNTSSSGHIDSNGVGTITWYYGSGIQATVTSITNVGKNNTTYEKTNTWSYEEKSTPCIDDSVLRNMILGVEAKGEESLLYKLKSQIKKSRDISSSNSGVYLPNNDSESLRKLDTSESLAINENSLNELLSLASSTLNMQGPNTYIQRKMSIVNDHSSFVQNELNPLEDSYPASRGDLSIIDSRNLSTSNQGYAPVYLSVNISATSTDSNLSGLSSLEGSRIGNFLSPGSTLTPYNIDASTGAHKITNTTQKNSPSSRKIVGIKKGSRVTPRDVKKIVDQINQISQNYSGDVSYTHNSQWYTATVSDHTSHSQHSVHANNHGSHRNCKMIYKENIKNYELPAMDILKKVKVVSFNYKEEYASQYKEDPSITHYGFIAEDTPEELSTKNHDRMDYMNCIGILIKAVQELDEKINFLEKQLQSVKKEDSESTESIGL